MDNHDELQRLATRMGRPVTTLVAFSELPADKLSWLEERVAESCRCDQALMQAELKHVLPWPFSALMAWHFRQQA